MSYVRGIGAELGTGLAALAQNLIGTQNTLEQQAQARKQQELDNAFRQQQADEQRRQFDAQARQARDSQTYQYLAGQGQNLTQILAKGGYAKGSPEYTAAETALKEVNKLSGRVLRGETLSPADLEGFDTLMGNVGAVTGQGAATVGERAAAQDAAALAATQTGTTATADANTRANQMQPLNLAQATNAVRTGTAQANVAEATQGDQITQSNLQTQAAQIGVDTARWQLGDMQTKAPLVYQGMQLANQAAQQANDFNTAANPERLTALRQSNEQTRQQIDQNAELFPYQKDLLTSQLDLAEIQVEIAEGTKSGTIDGTNAQNWQTIAMLGNPAKFDELVKKGLMTPQQAAPYKRLAEARARQMTAQTTAAEAQATTAQSQARVQTGTEGAQISAAQSGAQQAAAQARTAGVQANVAEATQGAQVQTIQAGAQQAQADAAVATGTVQPRIQAATSGAQTAAAQATSAQAQAQVDVATIPAMIAARQVSVQQAQAALQGQLTENRFADATFGARVQAINLNNATATQQLLAMKQQYSQNAAKFPAELKYLDAQIAVMQANARQAAAAALDANGNGVTDRKSMLQALDSMRKINADERRIASTNLQNTVKRLIPNAKFSVDKYDPKSFTALVATASNLTPDQRAELEQAQLAFEAASSKSSDLSTAIGQVAAKGRVDPKIAERLGIYSPGEADAGGGNYITGPSSPPAKAPKAQNVPAGVVSGKGGVVFSGGGARAVQSLLPQSEITKQIGMTVDHYLGKIKQQGGYSNPWDNTAGPVRAYNGMRPTLDVQLRYVNDIKATYDAQPWVQAMNDATGARRTELQFINSEADRIAKAKGVDPNVIKAIMWNESMGWQPGIPSSDGKGGGLGQVTGYFPPRGSTYSSNTRGGSSAPSGPAAQGGAGVSAGPAAPASQPKAQPATTPTSGLILNGKNISAGGAKLLKDAYTTAMNSKGTPQEKQAKAVQISATLAPMLSQQLGVTVTPQQVFIFLRDNGGRL